MDFLGIGPLELIVVLIIALIVVGPERLPEIAQTIGKTVRDLRAMSQGFAAEWQREIQRAADLDPSEDLQQALTQPFKEAQADLQRAANTPLTSPSAATAKLPPPEPSSQDRPTPLTNESSIATAELPPPEPSSQEQSNAQSDDVDHGDN